MVYLTVIYTWQGVTDHLSLCVNRLEEELAGNLSVSMKGLYCRLNDSEEVKFVIQDAVSCFMN